MQLIPEQGDQRWLALGLLLIALILVYMLGFHWFFQRHMQLSEEITTARNSLARFEAVSGQTSSIKKRLANLHASQAKADYFLPKPSFNIAAAWLQNRLKKLVEANTAAHETCNVTSQQAVTARDFDRFEPVQVRVRLQCGPGTLLRVLYELESNQPMLFVDEVNFNRVSRGVNIVMRRKKGKKPGQAMVDARFSIVGYLRPGAVKSS